MLSGCSSASLRRVILLLLGVTLVPLVVVVWLGSELLRQDRELEKVQRHDRLERSADTVSGALERAIAASEQRLAAGATDWANGAVVLSVNGNRIEFLSRTRPAYLPVVSAAREPPSAAFAEAERLEFRENNRAGAVATYRQLAGSADAAIRAGATLRLGRNLAALGRVDDALAAYAQLIPIEGVAETQVPIGLIGRYSRCVLLHQVQRDAAFRAELEALQRDLASGRWQLTAPVYALYAASADEWGTPHSDERRRSELFAEALAQVWHERHPRATRYSLMVANEPVVVLSQSSGGPARLLLASTDFVRTQWLASAEAVAREQQLSVSVRGSRDARLFEFGPDTRGVAAAAANSVTRTAVQTTLPWTIVVTGQNTAEDQRFAERRRLLVAGFVLLLVMALAASYAITRAVSREIAVGRLQSDFVAAVSHEFRTPLTTLRQFTDMLREQRQLTDERRRLCYDAQARATERLTRLVESVLDFGRLEAGARPYRFELCDCTELVSRVVQDFRGEPKAAEHDLQFRASGAVPIDADAEALARAVWNLIDNAVKYSPEGGPVEVNVTTGSGSVSITVRDHGIGIPAGERQAIFGKFQRGEQARLRGIKGTGIGLAMVDHIVKAHRGHIHVQGEPGAGSTFTIVLPAPASQTLQRYPHVHAEASTCASGGATLPTALG